jgi:hypothetical protein
LNLNPPDLSLPITRITVVSPLHPASAAFSCLILGYSSLRSKKTLGQKLLSMLPSENDSKMAEDLDNPQEVLKMLIDLVSTFFHSFFVGGIVNLVYLPLLDSKLYLPSFQLGYHSPNSLLPYSFCACLKVHL